jgi:ribosomal protein S21
MKDAQLKALLKKTQQKASQVKKPAKQAYDPTLEATRGSSEPLQGSEAEGIFKEMKRREF